MKSGCKSQIENTLFDIKENAMQNQKVDFTWHFSIFWIGCSNSMVRFLTKVSDPQRTSDIQITLWKFLKKKLLVEEWFEPIFLGRFNVNK